MPAAQYNEFFGGFLAFRYGKAVKTKNGGIKVFKTYEEALKAAWKSKMQCC